VRQPLKLLKLFISAFIFIMKCYNENFNEDVANGTLNSILKLRQAGLKEGEIAIPEPSTKAVSIEVTA
jgi:hypothetical protein